MRLKIDHQEAIRSQAAERYVSHELSPAERQSFEAHFFECPVCAEEVRLELTFAANVRAVSREMRADRQPAPDPLKARPWERCREWLRRHPIPAISLAANLALLAGLAFLLATRPVPAPRLAAVYFAPGPTHGAEDVHTVPAAEPYYGVRFPAPSAASQSYSSQILDAAGKPESSASLKAPASQDGFLYLQVPVDRLPGGVHTLVVRGEPGGEIVSWSKFRTSH